ncbi:MAG: DUF1501 domain-containing protein [Polyangiaceae bacterium]
MKTLSRRRLLVSSLAGAGMLLPALSRRGRAGGRAVGKAKNLIVVYASGGWDTTYAVDPKPGRANVDAPDGSEKMYGEYPIFIDSARPAIEKYFDAHADVTAIVNGINVASIAHMACRMRMFTGTRVEGAPDFAAITSNELGAELAIPYLVFGDAAFPGPFGVNVGRVGRNGQLRTLLEANLAYPLVPEAGYERYFPGDAGEAAIRDYVLARTSRRRATEVSEHNLARLDDFELSRSRGDALLPHADVLGEPGRILEIDEQLPLAIDAIQQQVSYAVMVSSRNNSWDSHANNGLRQSNLHDDLFESLDVLVKELRTRPGASAGSSMLDDTAVVVVSEMGRTPLLNGNGGKDHWPFTSAMVIGAGVAGGKLCGGTDDSMLGRNVDLETGQVSDAGVALYSESFLAGILELVGIASDEHLSGVPVLRGFMADA